MVGHQAHPGKLHFPHPLVSGYPCRTARSAQSPLAHPNKGGQNQKSKPPLGVTMMPLGAPSISKYGSLVRLDAQIVALRAQCARTALKAPPMYIHDHDHVHTRQSHHWDAMKWKRHCCSRQQTKGCVHGICVLLPSKLTDLVLATTPRYASRAPHTHRVRYSLHIQQPLGTFGMLLGDRSVTMEVCVNSCSTNLALLLVLIGPQKRLFGGDLSTFCNTHHASENIS